MLSRFKYQAGDHLPVHLGIHYDLEYTSDQRGYIVIGWVEIADKFVDIKRRTQKPKYHYHTCTNVGFKFRRSWCNAVIISICLPHLKTPWHVECKHTMVYMCKSIREYKCKVEVTSVICITPSSCMNMVCDGAYCICSSHTGVSNRDRALTMY